MSTYLQSPDVTAVMDMTGYNAKMYKYSPWALILAVVVLVLIILVISLFSGHPRAPVGFTPSTSGISSASSTFSGCGWFPLHRNSGSCDDTCEKNTQRNMCP